MMSLLNILVLYIMLLNHSVKHMSQPADCIVCFAVSDEMNLKSFSVLQLPQRISLFPYLLPIQFLKSKYSPQGGHFLVRQEILDEGGASSH